MSPSRRAARDLVPSLMVSLLVVRSCLAQAAPSPGRTPTPTTSISGKVVSATGEPAAGARLTILELRRRVLAGPDGAFEFAAVPAGTYLIEAASPRFGSSVTRVTASPSMTPLRITLEIGIHREAVTVSPNGEARATSELAQPVDVLEGAELAQRLQPTLGETLSGQAGVNSTFFGQGASRPVIRGLSGDRIRILEGGIGAGDVSDTSPDHAVTVNTLATEKVEVIRGPATLLYGSSAIGGAVNASDGRIATYLPDHAVSGSADASIGSVAGAKHGALSLNGRVGRFVLHGDVSRLVATDYAVPGFASANPEDGDVEGSVPNSAVASDGAAASVSYVGHSGYLGVSYSDWASLYGSPAEEDVTLDVKRSRVDVRGEISTPLAFLRGAKLRIGRNDYRHSELASGEVGTRFNDAGWEGRLELPHRPLGPLTGTVGVQVRRRDLEAVGEERFLPPTTSESQALFFFEEMPLGPVRLQLGSRFEHQSVASPETEEVQIRSFNGYSGSLGFVYSPAMAWSISLSVARTTKLPNAQELFANGPHVATRSFEIGDPGLTNEISTGVDLSIHRNAGIVTGTASLFYNRFSDFIYERITGEVMDELQVIRFSQADARFSGGEGHLDFALVHTDTDRVALTLGADFVRASLTGTDEPLPRIPPLRLSAGLRYIGSPWQALVEMRRVQKQDRVAAFENQTAGYTLLNASVGYRLVLASVVADLLLRGTNLTDAEARNHLSFLKDVAPLPGRNLSLSFRAMF